MAGMSGTLAPALMASGTVMSATGYMQAANATKLMAQRRQQAAEFAATQLEQNAGQETAAGQAAAQEQARQGKIVGSNILARAAASGGGASDPTVVSLIARNAGQSSYRAALASYQGLAQARQLNLQASGQRYGAALTGADAEAAANAYQGRGFATALTGFGTMYDKYFAKPDTGMGDVGMAKWYD